MHDQKTNQTAMLIRASKEATMDVIEELILLLALWVLVVIS
jgi:hypothetical protein